MGHECLLCAEEAPVDGAIHVGEKCLVDVFHLAGLEAEAAGVSNLRELPEKPLAKLDPVSYDAELAWLVVKEAAHVANDDLVDIKKERRSFETRQALAEKAELHENVGPVVIPAWRRLGEWRRLYAVDETCRIVGDADKAEGAVHMRLYAGIKAVNVVGTI